MSTPSSFTRAALPGLAALLLSGCAAIADPHVHGAASGAPATAGSSGMGMDMQAMCDMHRQEMAGRTPQERQAMMDDHMRSMTPEMRERMRSMMAQCR